jgi:ribulose kinase
MKTWKPQDDFVEQSSNDIWAVCCSATRQAALKLPIIKGDAVAGIGFDATCSPVGLDQVFRRVDRLRTQRTQENERN